MTSIRHEMHSATGGGDSLTFLGYGNDLAAGGRNTIEQPRRTGCEHNHAVAVPGASIAGDCARDGDRRSTGDVNFLQV